MGIGWWFEGGRSPVAVAEAVTYVMYSIARSSARMLSCSTGIW